MDWVEMIVPALIASVIAYFFWYFKFRSQTQENRELVRINNDLQKGIEALKSENEKKNKIIENVLNSHSESINKVFDIKVNAVLQLWETVILIYHKFPYPLSIVLDAKNIDECNELLSYQEAKTSKLKDKILAISKELKSYDELLSINRPLINLNLFTLFKIYIHALLSLNNLCNELLESNKVIDIKKNLDEIKFHFDKELIKSDYLLDSIKKTETFKTLFISLNNIIISKIKNDILNEDVSENNYRNVLELTYNINKLL